MFPLYALFLVVRGDFFSLFDPRFQRSEDRAQKEREKERRTGRKKFYWQQIPSSSPSSTESSKGNQGNHPRVKEELEEEELYLCTTVQLVVHFPSIDTVANARSGARPCISFLIVQPSSTTVQEVVQFKDDRYSS